MVAAHECILREQVFFGIDTSDTQAMDECLSNGAATCSRRQLGREYEIWSLFEAGHTARAFVETTLHGQALRIEVDGLRVSSEIFGLEDAGVHEVALGALRAFRAHRSGSST